VQDRNELISSTYRDLNAQLHETHRYGSRGDKWADKVVDLATTYGVTSILDYGCGKGALKTAISGRLAAVVSEYDPAIPGKQDMPVQADMVVCTDVLEHIEPECLDAVIAHLHSLTNKIMFAAVSTRLAVKTLADGRNAHLIVQSADIWRPLLVRDMTVLEWEERGDEFFLVLKNA
jgi:2-polyprenyl-3-methyl-5-hydroxy-6-metoxy-1,4-benzoquinol methylase